MCLFHLSAMSILFASQSEYFPLKYSRITEGSFPWLSVSVQLHWSIVTLHSHSKESYHVLDTSHFSWIVLILVYIVS